MQTEVEETVVDRGEDGLREKVVVVADGLKKKIDHEEAAEDGSKIDRKVLAKDGSKKKIDRKVLAKDCSKKKIVNREFVAKGIGSSRKTDREVVTENGLKETKETKEKNGKTSVASVVSSCAF